jgi:uncharacterized membrane protein YkgB
MASELLRIHQRFLESPRRKTAMESASFEAIRARSVLEHVGTIALDDVGKTVVRWGLVIVLAWIGAMKFTGYEATGIQPLVAHSPLLSWAYDISSVRSFAAALGVIEIGTATLIALRPVSPIASAVGGVLGIGMFITTLSFLFSTPGWEPTLGGFPALSAMPGQFLLKDVVLLGASIWILGDSLKAMEAAA